ncbi:hypothetical protein OG871_38720 [Kitasatospora sp. NBC_00374]|uniref:hypothetical protein n=1 Tax=Kitasatospora sp. NBC_00374 TaxID=2975964 RepID=UPI0030E5C0A6
MSSGEFRIDLQEVEAAARKIRSLVAELEPHTAEVEAAVQGVSRAEYGTESVGAALLGGGSGVGGLVEHQKQAVEGIRRYLQNSAAMADNLLLMCRHYREADDGHAAELLGILGEAGGQAAGGQAPGVQTPGVQTPGVQALPLARPAPPVRGNPAV